MRLAQFVQRYPPSLGGAEAYVARLGRWLAARGDRVTVWTTAADELAAFWSPTARTFDAGETEDQGVTVRRYPLWRMRGRRWLLKPLSLVPLRAWQALTLPSNPISVRMWRDAATTADRFDAVHASAFPYAWPIMCGLRLARRQDVPFLLTPFLHLGDRRTRRAYTQPALKRLLLAADVVFAQTQLEADAVAQLGVRTDRIVLQGLGVDPAECTGGSRERGRATWDIPERQVVVGHLANLSAEKGSIDLVRATERCEATVTLLLAGPAMPNFDRFLSRWRGRTRVVRTGTLSDDSRRDFFAACDLFALPSRSDSFGLVLLEAWANGLPNVVYRAGGPGELVRHGTDGLSVPCGDLAALGHAIGLLANDPARRTAMGEAGRERIRPEFCWDNKLEIFATSLGRLSCLARDVVPMPTAAN